MKKIKILSITVAMIVTLLTMQVSAADFTVKYLNDSALTSTAKTIYYSEEAGDLTDFDTSSGYVNIIADDGLWSQEVLWINSPITNDYAVEFDMAVPSGLVGLTLAQESNDWSNNKYMVQLVNLSSDNKNAKLTKYVGGAYSQVTPNDKVMTISDIEMEHTYRIEVTKSGNTCTLKFFVDGSKMLDDYVDASISDIGRLMVTPVQVDGTIVSQANLYSVRTYETSTSKEPVDFSATYSTNEDLDPINGKVLNATGTTIVNGKAHIENGARDWSGLGVTLPVGTDSDCAIEIDMSVSKGIVGIVFANQSNWWEKSYMMQFVNLSPSNRNIKLAKYNSGFSQLNLSGPQPSIDQTHTYRIEIYPISIDGAPATQIIQMYMDGERVIDDTFDGTFSSGSIQIVAVSGPEDQGQPADAQPSIADISAVRVYDTAKGGNVPADDIDGDGVSDYEDPDPLDPNVPGEPTVSVSPTEVPGPTETPNATQTPDPDDESPVTGDNIPFITILISLAALITVFKISKQKSIKSN